MLYCSEERLVPTNINLMTIESSDGMYYYVHRSLYDQAVILNDRYKGKEDELKTLIGRYSSSDTPECVSYFHVVVPEPLNILGYFLALIDGFETMSEDIEVLCGVVHQMSAALNFKSLIGIPPEMRAQARFSLSIESEFRLSWDRFFQESLPYDPDMFLGKRETVYINSGNVNDNYVEDNSFDDEEEEVFDWSEFMDDLDNKTDEEKEETKEEVVTEVPVEEDRDDGADLLDDLV